MAALPPLAQQLAGSGIGHAVRVRVRHQTAHYLEGNCCAYLRSVKIETSNTVLNGRNTIMQEIVDKYIAAWNETDPQRRRALIEHLWAADGSYTDPLADVRGRAEIDAVIAAAQQQFAGLVFSLGGPVDANHNQARFTWHLGPAGGEPVVIGFDVAVVNGDGQLSSVHGFLDKVPAAA
jgi:hypothetical protein